MPRASRIPAILRCKLKQTRVTEHKQDIRPRLWNAKRRINQSIGLVPADYKLYEADPGAFDWRSRVSKDVVEYIDNNTLLPEEQASVLRYPSRWFSRPHHVPVEQRKQVYFPRFAIILWRTPHLGPYYASFQVPMHFNKLDMKAYLKDIYNVDVVHVRSTIVQSQVHRRTPTRAQGGRGSLFRPTSTKRMTVQLVDPFEWPKEVTDFTPWEKDEYWKVTKGQYEQQRLESDWLKLNANENHRKSIAEQAKSVLAGKTKWKPTWQQIPIDSRVLSGSISAAPSTPSSSSATR